MGADVGDEESETDEQEGFRLGRPDQKAEQEKVGREFTTAVRAKHF